MPPDYYGLLQLYKNNPLLIKPSGWLYFTLYDLGIIGFFVATFFIFFKYLKCSLSGIIRCNYSIILLISIQISLLFVPLLPSTPSVFFPLAIAESIMQYKENKENLKLNNDS